VSLERKRKGRRMKMSRKKHYWLVLYRGGPNYIIGSFLESKRQLKEYLDGSLEYEDREIEIDEIFDALLLSKSVKKTKVGDEELIIIHFITPQEGEKK
jgi:hypothetical protein